MPSLSNEGLNLFVSNESNSADKDLKRLIQDESNIFDIRRILAEERARLERLSWACDQLKLETMRRLTCVSNLEKNLRHCELEVNVLQNYAINMKTISQGLNNRFQNEHMKEFDGDNGEQEEDLPIRYQKLHDEIEATYQNLKSRDDLFKQIWESSIIVGFHQTKLPKNYKLDELLIDFQQSLIFPAGLFIASAILQEVFVDTLVNHDANVDNHNTNVNWKNEDCQSMKSYSTLLDGAPKYCNGNQLNVCPASKEVHLLESLGNNSLMATSQKFKSVSSPITNVKQNLVEGSLMESQNNAFLSPVPNGIHASFDLDPRSRDISPNVATTITNEVDISTLQLIEDLQLSDENVDDRLAYGNSDFGVLPYSNGEADRLPMKSTWSQVSSIHCPDKVSHDAQIRQQQLLRPEKIVAETNRPHCFLDISMKNQEPVRVIIKVRPDKAPLMAENFIQLCTGKLGFGYKGSKVIRCKADDHILAGDITNNDGTGGKSIYGDDPNHQKLLSQAFYNTDASFSNENCFLAEQCSLKDHKGAVRMRGLDRSLDGRCKVGSQFMIWVGDIEYKEYKYTLVFGEVTQGLKFIQEISRIGMFCNDTTWLLKDEVVITNCGVL